MDENTKLLPCPFCGSVDTSVIGEDGWKRVSCKTCGTVGPMDAGYDEATAIKLWNKRAEPISAEAGVMIQRKTWGDMRRTGLLWWVNRMLHTFGWAIVVTVGEDQSIYEAYPARVKFRGFGVDVETDGFKKLTRYMSEAHPHLMEDLKWDQDSIPVGSCGCRHNGVPIMRADCKLHAGDES